RPTSSCPAGGAGPRRTSPRTPTGSAVRCVSRAPGSTCPTRPPDLARPAVRPPSWGRSPDTPRRQPCPVPPRCHSGAMDRDRDGRGEGAHDPRRDQVADAYHHEIDDPPTWDDDTYAVTGPVEAHGRSLDLGLLLLRLAGLPLVLHGIAKAVDMPA